MGLLKTLTKLLHLTAALVILSGAAHESPDETLTTTTDHYDLRQQQQPHHAGRGVSGKQADSHGT